jgi:para-nitrobenzyl esterase
VSTESLVIDTSQGRLRGVRAEGVLAFKGIPYGAPPVGDRRLRAPVRAGGWDGVRDAVAFGPTPPATGYTPPFDRIFLDPVIPGDDWLTVNVWTPDPAARGLPVMVWIHGGAFRNGATAAPLYDGSAFARDGVVFVSVNYRLGADGFLFLDDAEANRGLLDQVLALRWVQENVSAFGGDPGNVTVFGESAGAMSVCALLSIPPARGLFHRAIAQSGGGHHALSPQDARRVTAAIAEDLGVPPTREGIATADIGRLRESQAKISLQVASNPDPGRWGRLALDVMPFEPTLDGAVLPVLPIEAIGQGAGKDVGLLTGTTADEWHLFTVPPGLIDVLSDQHVKLLLAAYGASGDDVAGVYADLDGTPGERFCAIATDWFLRIPAIRLAEARAGGPAPTHLYEFAWRSPEFGGRLGACHALELPFVFDTLETESGRALAGTAPPRSLADAMHRAWVAFAHDGDPGWPAYEPATRPVMVFDEHSTVVEDPGAIRRLAWDGLR